MNIIPPRVNPVIIAINKKHQAAVNRFISWAAKYDLIVDQTDDSGSLKQERAFDKACDYWNELPKREQKNISKQIETSGY